MAVFNKRHQRVGVPPFSISTIAAMTFDKVVSMQLVEGGIDSVIFENFLYYTLKKIRNDPLTRDKQVVILLDNATIHKVSSVYETARKMNASIIMNAEYSPFLNPIEQLWRRIKSKIRQMDPRPKKDEMAPTVQKMVREFNRGD